MDLIRQFLPHIQIVLSALLVVAILVQRSEAGLGGTFGGGSGFGDSFHTKRGFERTLFIITIILGILFLATALAAFYIKTV